MLVYLLSIISLGALCAGWVLVQLIARRLQTKNHFDHLEGTCGQCTCGGGGINCNIENKEYYSRKTGEYNK